jgi:hypothetical protein
LMATSGPFDKDFNIYICREKKDECHYSYPNQK